MTTALERRLSEIEAHVAQLVPPAPSPLPAHLAWIGWASDSELTWLEELSRRWEYDGIPPSEPEQLQLLEVELRSTRRRLDGEPPYVERGPYREDPRR
jgi:hypothetical protein